VKGFGISDNKTSGHIGARDSGVDNRLCPLRLDNQGPRIIMGEIAPTPHNVDSEHRLVSGERTLV